MSMCMMCNENVPPDGDSLCENCKSRIVREPNPEIEPPLTKEQIRFIATSGGRCPYCGSGNLVVGPTAGASLNCRCDVCLLECNLMTFSGSVLQGERIVRDKPLPEEFWNRGKLNQYLNRRPQVTQ